jgi:dolichol kinase
MAAIYASFGLSVSWICLAAASAIFVPLDLLRPRWPGLNRVTLAIFGPFMRDREATGISGLTFMIGGCCILLFLFGEHRHLVILTLLLLAVGDPVASLFGVLYGRDRIWGQKTLQGTMAAFFACSAVAAVYFFWNNLMFDHLLIVVPITGLIAAASELVPVGKLDDNFTFPIVTSGLLWALMTMYGGLSL